MRVHSIVNGVSINYTKETSNGLALERYIVEYGVKGPNPEFIMKVLRDNSQIK